MERKMETTVWGLGFRVQHVVPLQYIAPYNGEYNWKLKQHRPALVARTWLWVYYNKIPIDPHILST